MFTGIIKELGEVISYDAAAFRLRIRCPLFKNIKLGASIAINGVCLTASSFDAETFTVSFDIGQETREKSLITKFKEGRHVNVELALSLGDAIDGHLVQGHVDATSELIKIDTVDNGTVLRFRTQRDVLNLIVQKGSIAIDGVSLTVNETAKDWFSVCLVPYTILHTSFKDYREGDFVHLETDIVGRYLYHFYRREEPIHLFEGR